MIWVRFLVDNVQLVLLVCHIAFIEDLAAEASVSARKIFHFSQRCLHLRFVYFRQSTQLVLGKTKGIRAVKKCHSLIGSLLRNFPVKELIGHCLVWCYLPLSAVGNRSSNGRSGQPLEHVIVGPFNEVARPHHFLRHFVHTVGT